MDDNEQISKSKSVIKEKIEEGKKTPNKKLNFKGKQLSFSQASEISEDTRDNHKLFSPVSNNKINNIMIQLSAQNNIITQSYYKRNKHIEIKMIQRKNKEFNNKCATLKNRIQIIKKEEENYKNQLKYIKKREEQDRLIQNDKIKIKIELEKMK